MKYTKILLILLIITVLLFSFNIVSAHKYEKTGIVTNVYDGDTIYVSGG